MKIEEKVEVIRPISMQTPKPRMSPRQKTMSETTGRSVVTDVRTVRESVAFTQRFTIAGKSVFCSPDFTYIICEK